MTCRDVQGLCTLYVDGELDEARASALRGHIRGCAACRKVVEEEALVRDAGADLGPIDPPPELWQGIQRRLADAEVADSERSRTWLLWQRLRPHALTAAVATAAAAVLIVWLVRRDGDGSASDGVAIEDVQPELPPGPQPLPPAPLQPQRTFEELRTDELAAADATYDQVIVDLRKIVAEERATWSPAAARKFDARMAALVAEAGAARRKIGGGVTPHSRDSLYANLREQIALLERAAMGDLP